MSDNKPIKMWAAYKNERLYFLIKEECSSHYDVETAEQDGYTCREVLICDPALLDTIREAANIVAAARVLMAANQIASITEWEKMDDVEAQLRAALTRTEEAITANAKHEGQS